MKTHTLFITIRRFISGTGRRPFGPCRFAACGPTTAWSIGKCACLSIAMLCTFLCSERLFGMQLLQRSGRTAEDVRRWTIDQWKKVDRTTALREMERINRSIQADRQRWEEWQKSRRAELERINLAENPQLLPLAVSVMDARTLRGKFTWNKDSLTKAYVDLVQEALKDPQKNEALIKRLGAQIKANSNFFDYGQLMALKKVFSPADFGEIIFKNRENFTADELMTSYNDFLPENKDDVLKTMAKKLGNKENVTTFIRNFKNSMTALRSPKEIDKNLSTIAGFLNFVTFLAKNPDNIKGFSPEQMLKDVEEIYETNIKKLFGKAVINANELSTLEWGRKVDAEKERIFDKASQTIELIIKAEVHLLVDTLKKMTVKRRNEALEDARSGMEKMRDWLSDLWNSLFNAEPGAEMSYVPQNIASYLYREEKRAADLAEKSIIKELNKIAQSAFNRVGNVPAQFEEAAKEPADVPIRPRQQPEQRRKFIAVTEE